MTSEEADKILLGYFLAKGDQALALKKRSIDDIVYEVIEEEARLVVCDPVLLDNCNGVITQYIIREQEIAADTLEREKKCLVGAHVCAAQCGVEDVLNLKDWLNNAGAFRISNDEISRLVISGEADWGDNFDAPYSDYAATS